MHGCTERKSVGLTEMDGERAERVTQLKWTLQWQRGHSWTNAGHLCNKAEEHLHPHCGQKERGKEPKKHIHMCKHNLTSLFSYNDALSTTVSPPFLPLSIKPLSKQTAELPSVMEKSVSLYLTYPAVTFPMNNTHMQRGGECEGQGDKMEVELSSRASKKKKKIRVEQEDAGGQRALTQHSDSDCRLSTSSNCQGQTLSISALGWTNNGDAVVLCAHGGAVWELNKGAFTAKWTSQ